ncbi:ATP-dependent rna helicase dbp7 [Verticillium dahliae]
MLRLLSLPPPACSTSPPQRATDNMADDGMILNFAVSDAPAKTQVKFQGGKWRDRLKAQRNANRSSTPQTTKPTEAFPSSQQRYIPGSKPNPSKPNPRQNGGDGDDLDQRPAKRMRADPHMPSSYQTGKLPPGSIVIGKREGTGLAKGQVTSKLFTSNPMARTVFDDPSAESKPDAEPAQPSNAPLSEEAASFHALGISRRLAQDLSGKVKLKAPTAIQAKVIPQLIKEDSDAFVQAQTGSGKTLAYLLPILQRILAVADEGKVRRDSGLFAMVLAPTRELCRQIDLVLQQLLPQWLVSTTVIGGESKHSEKSRLRKGVNILIATPGRLTDHLANTKALDVGSVRWLVLDEGDRLMEMGFEDDLREIVGKIRAGDVSNRTKDGVSLELLPKRRVTVLCSATMKMDVQRLGEISLEDAVHITAEDEVVNGEGEEQQQQQQPVAFSAPAQLKQAHYIVPAKLRLVSLIALLKSTFARRGSVMKAIVFMSCADSVDYHFDLLKEPPKADRKTESTAVTANTVAPAAYLASPANPNIVLHKLHGSLPQPVRTGTLAAYSTCTEPCVLITTDIASRGLDVPSVELVIEYDPAFSAADHVHRIGRTARAGRPGKAVLFLQPGCEEGYVDYLTTATSVPKAESFEGVLHRGLATHMPFPVDTDAKPPPEDSRSFSQRAEALQLHIEQRLLIPSGAALLEAARKGFRSHVRAYATHTKEERKFFDITELHLGHTAKSYGLREAPQGVGRGGHDGKKTAMKAAASKKRKQGAGDSARESLFDADTDLAEMERRMKMKMKTVMNSASEFNIG